MQHDDSTLGLLIRKVQTMSPEQKKSILETDAKLKQWFSSHPGQKVTADKVPEVLSIKPETPKEKLEKMFEPLPIVEQPIRIESTTTNIVKPQINPSLAEIKEDSEKKIAAIRANQPKTPEVTHSMIADSELAKQVEQAFESEINDIYGKKGIFGSTKGLDTSEWKFMRSLPATKVISYYQADSDVSALDPATTEELTNSSKHQAFLKQMDALSKETRGMIKPYENEMVEQFLKRLGHFVMREHLEKATINTQKSGY